MKNKAEIIVLTIMCFILTIAISIQIKTVNKNGTTLSSNQSESNLKAQVLKMKEKYENQYDELEEKTLDLEEARQQATQNNTELEEIENKIKKYNIILGNTDVVGEGVIVTLSDGKSDTTVLEPDNLNIHAENILLVVSELKNAGAEAISINGERIVGSTAIQCDGNVIVVNGNKVSSPIEITAIGRTEVLTTLNRAGGTLENFKEQGKQVELKKIQSIKIPKYTGVMSFKYAQVVK